MGQIKMVYGADGSVKVEPTGFPGGKCDAATRPYEAGHGISDGDKIRTEEFTQPVTAGIEQNQNQGV